MAHCCADEALVVGDDGVDLGIEINVDRPRAVGADRIVNALAAYELFGGPIIAVDFGTATTFDCVDASGAYVGGAIAPGLQISAEALTSRTARLAIFTVAGVKAGDLISTATHRSVCFPAWPLGWQITGMWLPGWCAFCGLVHFYLPGHWHCGYTSLPGF